MIRMESGADDVKRVELDPLQASLFTQADVSADEHDAHARSGEG